MKIRAYHGSSLPIRKFDLRYCSQGVLWFSEDKNSILQGTSGANSVKWIMTVDLLVNKVAGWDLYESLALQQIESMGYDSIKLDDDWVVFSPDNVNVVKVQKT